LVRLGVTVAGLAVAAGVAQGQQDEARPQNDSRWQPFAGCWAPGSDSATPLAENAPVVCLAPTGNTVEMVAVGDGKVVARERVVASGARVPNERDGCTGWEQATWSADGHRLFRRAEFTCANGVHRVTQGVFAIAPDGAWLDVRGAGTGANAGVIAIRYRPTAIPAGLPAEMKAAIPAVTTATYDARAFAAVPLGPAEVVEASRLLDAPVASTLLVERGQGFLLDGKLLTKLADQGVPGRVIDAMVALSYPKVFAINRNGAMPDRREPVGPGESVATTGRTIPVYIDPWGWSPYGYGYGSGYGYGRYSPYGYGYSPYGYGYGGYYGSGGPIIVVRPPSDDNSGSGHGRVVNGRGYTRSGGSGGSASPAFSGDGGSSRGTSSSGGGSSAGGSSAGSSGGGGRTAKPRDP
jgi:hypothetical protein